MRAAIRSCAENQLALTLKTLCGFGVSEIARALIGEETVKKASSGPRASSPTNHVTLEPPDATQLFERLTPFIRSFT